ncbi:MAG: tRNA(Arg) A34 adenosine deaminase TadA [Paracoccaceae bacterium]|jgi:tRNA(Arg) A34 adenosine deaminase TadA
MSVDATPSRRALLAGLAAAPLTLRAASAQKSSFRQPARATPAGFMAVADDMLKTAVDAGDQPYGAVVVKDERIVGWGPSRVVTDTDPTAHAEMIALRDAAKRLGTANFAGCTMYSTSHPCPMCEAGAYWAGIDRFVHGNGRTDGGAPQLRRC